MSIVEKRDELAGKREDSPQPEATERRGRGRPKVVPDAEQAASIARKARELFLEKGYGRTTMDDIVARCRISKSTLYRLFPNKAEVLGAVIDDHRQEMLALPVDDDDLPIDEALARIFRVDIDDDANQERMALVHFVIVEAREFPELHDLLHKRGADRSRQDLAQWLKRQKEKGRIDLVDAEDAAKALMDLMFGAMAKRPPGPDSEWLDRQERIRCQRARIAMITRGILPR